MELNLTEHLPDDLRRQAIRVFNDPFTMATTGLMLCLQLFDEECREWDPVFLEEAIRERTSDGVHADVMQRIQAAITVLDSPRFFREAEIFHIVCATMLDPDTKAEQMAQSPSPVELAWTCTEVRALIGEEYKNDLFYPQVRRYCGAALQDSGLYRPPPPLAFADFPGPVIPETISEDDTLLSSFMKEQERLLEDIDLSMRSLSKLYRQQLSGLSVFGGNQKAFGVLKTDEPSGV